MIRHFVELTIDVGNSEKEAAIAHLKELGWKHIKQASEDGLETFKKQIDASQLINWDPNTRAEVASSLYAIKSVAHTSHEDPSK